MGEKLSKNSFLIIWLIMLLKILTMKSGLEYIIIIVAGITILTNLKRLIFSEFELQVIKSFALFLGVLLIGFFSNPTFIALRTIIGGLSVLIIIIYGINFCTIRSPFFCGITFSGSCLTLISQYSINGNLGFEGNNTFAGILLFVYLLSVSFMLLETNYYEIVVFGIINYIFVFYLIFISNSRTSLIVLMGISVLCPIIILLRKLIDLIGYKLVFLSFFGVLLGIIAIYINVSSFSWFNSIDALSVAIFGKHLNSSRSFLWTSQLERISGMNLIWGLGTGKLPDLARYADSSFHNTFIQIFIQNGIIGVLSMILVLFVFWNKLGKFVKYKKAAIFLCFFIGIIVYNCFEVTMFSNKISIGIIQWMILIFGIKCTSCIEQNEKDKIGRNKS